MDNDTAVACRYCRIIAYIFGKEAGWSLCTATLVNTLMLKRIAAVLLVLGLAGAIFASAQTATFRVGVLADPLSPLAGGARLAAQQINDEGGVLGADGSRFRLELVIQPTAGGTALPQAIEALQGQNIVAVIGPATTEETLANLPLLQGLGVPILTAATGDTVLAQDASGLLVRTRATDFLQERALADYLINTLGLTRVATVQLDLNSTANVIGFTSAASGFGVPPSPVIIAGGETLEELAATLIAGGPQVTVIYGAPALAADYLTALRGAGYGGLVVYNQFEESAFAENIPVEQLEGIIGSTNWSYTAPDPLSTTFLDSFVRSFGMVPGPAAAAGYDSVLLLEAAIGLPGDLTQNLRTQASIIGVQGVLNPRDLGGGETSQNITVVRVNAFGSPEIAERFVGLQRLSPEQIEAALPTATPLPSPTPDGVVLTVLSQVQNVRRGPSTAFEVLGQLDQGEQRPIIGTNVGNTWVVIDFRGQQGWLFVDILEVFGDLNDLPIVASPPTPIPTIPPIVVNPDQLNTPIPGTTAVPGTTQQQADLVVVDVDTDPDQIIRGEDFDVDVTIENQGGTDAGTFAVAATFDPDEDFDAETVSGLAAGERRTIELNFRLDDEDPEDDDDDDGNDNEYEVVIVVDLNNQVDEGPGEDNNDDFVFRYDIEDDDE